MTSTTITTEYTYATNLSLIIPIMEITNLKNVFVNKISLVSKDENPAVPKSNIKYALFKTVKKADSGPSKLDTLVKTMQSNQKIAKVIEKIQSDTKQTVA